MTTLRVRDNEGGLGKQISLVLLNFILCYLTSYSPLLPSFLNYKLLLIPQSPAQMSLACFWQTFQLPMASPEISSRPLIYHIIVIVYILVLALNYLHGN